jgi:tripartite-type tricarboxylate transporter receptor subunit TctC
MRTLRAIAAGVIAVLSVAGQAQDYPNKPIRLVVPFATGGVTDSTARVMADKLSRQMNQQVIVENRPGGAGNPGSAYVAQSPADGYTLLLGFDGTMVINPSVYPKIPFDTMKDFQHVTKMGDAGLVLVAHPSVPARTFADLVAYSRANPGKLSFGHSGTGGTTHVAGELLKQRTGLDMQHIPYKSGGQAVIDTIGGQVPLAYSSVAGAQAHIKSGKLKAYGVSSLKRVSSLPDVPTFAELGIANFEAVSWVGIHVPARTPRPVVDRLYREIATALKDPDLRSRFETLGVEPVGNTPEEFTVQVREDLARWAKVVEAARIKLD